MSRPAVPVATELLERARPAVLELLPGRYRAANRLAGRHPWLLAWLGPAVAVTWLPSSWQRPLSVTVIVAAAVSFAVAVVAAVLNLRTEALAADVRRMLRAGVPLAAAVQVVVDHDLDPRRTSAAASQAAWEALVERP